MVSPSKNRLEDKRGDRPSRRGFAAMDPEKQRAIASMGGQGGACQGNGSPVHIGRSACRRAQGGGRLSVGIASIWRKSVARAAPMAPVRFCANPVLRIEQAVLYGAFCYRTQ